MIDVLRFVVGLAADVVRRRAGPVAENALLRQQLIVAQRKLAGRGPVDTVAALHDGTRRTHGAGVAGRHVARPAGDHPPPAPGRLPRVLAAALPAVGRPPTARAALIREMAGNNRLWGAERIRGELLTVGIRVGKRTIQKYMRRVREPRPPGQSWATFLCNHGHEIWACDFLQVCDLLFRPLFAFFLIELSSRRVVHVAVTRSPSSAWVTQQLREATAWGAGPRFLIRDHDDKFGGTFDAVAEATGITVVRPPGTGAQRQRRL